MSAPRTPRSHPNFMEREPSGKTNPAPPGLNTTVPSGQPSQTDNIPLPWTAAPAPMVGLEDSPAGSCEGCPFGTVTLQGISGVDSCPLTEPHGINSARTKQML